MKTITKLVKEIHQLAKDKGFWYDYEDINMYMGELNASGIKEKKLLDMCIGQKLMLIVSELGEALEALRNNQRANLDNFKLIHFREDISNINDYWVKKERECIKLFDLVIKDTFEDELADTVIRIFDLCGYLNIDLEKHIELKMAYNKTRPNKHGKEF